MMANLFEEGAANSVPNLLGLLGSFVATVAGFTYTVGVGKGPVGQDIHYFRKSGMTYAIVPFDSGEGFHMSMTPTAPSESGWGWRDIANTDKPRYEVYGYFYSNGGPYVKRWFYTDAAKLAVHVVVEVNSGQFEHFSFGLLDKFGSWTGGEYITSGAYYIPGQDVNYGFHRSPWEGRIISGQVCGYVRHYVGGNDLTDYAEFGKRRDSQLALGSTLNGFIDDLHNDAPNEIALRTPLLPNYIFLEEAIEGLWWPAGVVPGVRVLNIRDLSPRDIELTSWQVFPLAEKNGDSAVAPNSFNYGLAYERVVV